MDCAHLLLVGIFDNEVAGPLTRDGVDWLLAVLCEGSGERVFLAGAWDPASSAVVDSGDIARRGVDVGLFVEFDKGGASDKAFDVERRKGDQVCRSPC
jgi:hypothetical protein